MPEYSIKFRLNYAYSLLYCALSVFGEWFAWGRHKAQVTSSFYWRTVLRGRFSVGIKTLVPQHEPLELWEINGTPRRLSFFHIQLNFGAKYLRKGTSISLNIYIYIYIYIYIRLFIILYSHERPKGTIFEISPALLSYSKKIPFLILIKMIL